MVYQVNRIADSCRLAWLLGVMFLQSMVPGGNGLSYGQVVSNRQEPTAIQDSRITESSGLAISLRQPNHFWTHNDSGGVNELYAFDTTGRATGHAVLRDVKAVDWEDMASFWHQNEPWLVVADMGDNQARRESVSLHFLPEPDPTQSDVSIRVHTIVCQYPDGPRDCEAIAVDSQRKQVWLITKSAFPYAGVYRLDLPEFNSTNSVVDPPSATPQMLSKQGFIAVPMVTGMAIDPDNQHLVVANYLCTFTYPLQTDQPWWQREPVLNPLPALKQIEAIAVTDDGKLWVTTEGTPARLAAVIPSAPVNGSSAAFSSQPSTTSTSSEPQPAPEPSDE